MTVASGPGGRVARLVVPARNRHPAHARGRYARGRPPAVDETGRVCAVHRRGLRLAWSGPSVRRSEEKF